MRDLHSRIAFERVTDRYTDQRTHGRRQRRKRIKEGMYNKTDTLMR